MEIEIYPTSHSFLALCMALVEKFETLWPKSNPWRMGPIEESDMLTQKVQSSFCQNPPVN